MMELDERIITQNERPEPMIHHNEVSHLSEDELLSLHEILSGRGSMGVLIDTSKLFLNFNLALTIISADELVLERLIELSEKLLHAQFARWRVASRLLKLQNRGPKRKTVQWRNKNALRVFEAAHPKDREAELELAKAFIAAKYSQETLPGSSLYLQQMIYVAYQTLHGTDVIEKLESGEFDPRINFIDIESFSPVFDRDFSKIMGFQIDWKSLASVSKRKKNERSEKFNNLTHEVTS